MRGVVRLVVCVRRPGEAGAVFGCSIGFFLWIFVAGSFELGNLFGLVYTGTSNLL